MIVQGSALEDGIAEQEAIEAARSPILSFALDKDDNPGLIMRLSFNAKGRLLETAILIWGDGTEELIHCMKARSQYVNLLP